ncbi:Lysosome-associated membrane glycoprotein 2 [Liparis tanakae]|uniref:Lysosome-associated membrane glycoprotein 2 n=1 Tax=Liparis tanakae TaxID=230148 RepID=A0A4Z2HCQ6_9TELE|nr:Lysosome-associated membrane glycoprotein 2 [Liparis tanakae]
MYRYASVVCCLCFAIAFQLSHGTSVTVKDKDNNTCLYADLMINFTVSYEVSVNELNFGEGFSWSVNFTINGTLYKADTITFTYNLNDTTVFPNSVVNDTATVTAKPQIPAIDIDTCYSCNSKETLEADVVNQTLWNVLIQAFVSNNNISTNLSSCAADLPASTTVAPITNATTSTPVTNSSTAPPPTPTPTLPTPTGGKYSIKPDENSTACLIANFGLRINVKKIEMNFEPNGTTVSGSCGVNSSQLVLTSSSMTITLTFANDTKKFHLHALNITGKTSSGVEFSEVNTNLTLWEAAVGSSYMCNKEQNYTITSQLTLYTFDLQVQPFGVKKGVFSTAEDCQPDDVDSFIVPVAVGVSLLVLILIVLLAYFIGRRRNMGSTYESL